MRDLAQMSVHQSHISARSQPSGFAMAVGTKRNVLHPASHTRFFIGFPRGGIGVGCILIHSTFGKRPMTVSGAHQEELRFPVAYPIADRSHVNARETGR